MVSFPSQRQIHDLEEIFLDFCLSNSNNYHLNLNLLAKQFRHKAWDQILLIQYMVLKDKWRVKASRHQHYHNLKSSIPKPRKLLRKVATCLCNLLQRQLNLNKKQIVSVHIQILPLQYHLYCLDLPHCRVDKIYSNQLETTIISMLWLSKQIKL